MQKNLVRAIQRRAPGSLNCDLEMLFEGPRTMSDKKELLFRFEMFNKNALATDSCRTRPTVTNKTMAGALEACINVVGGCNCT